MDRTDHHHPQQQEVRQLPAGRPAATAGLQHLPHRGETTKVRTSSFSFTQILTLICPRHSRCPSVHRFTEKGNLEVLLFTIQSKMRANNQKVYMPREGKLISDINKVRFTNQHRTFSPNYCSFSVYFFQNHSDPSFDRTLHSYICGCKKKTMLEAVTNVIDFFNKKKT